MTPAECKARLDAALDRYGAARDRVWDAEMTFLAGNPQIEAAYDAFDEAENALREAERDYARLAGGSGSR